MSHSLVLSECICVPVMSTSLKSSIRLIPREHFNVYTVFGISCVRAAIQEKDSPLTIR